MVRAGQFSRALLALTHPSRAGIAWVRARALSAARRPSTSCPPRMPCSASADDPDLYAVLGVPPHADGATVRAAYRSLAAALHPDRQRDPALRDEATAAFRRVCEAHEILGDAARRAVYDAHGMRGIRAGLTLATTEGVQDAQTLREALLRRKVRRERRVGHSGAESPPCCALGAAVGPLALTRTRAYSGVARRRSAMSAARRSSCRGDM